MMEPFVPRLDFAVLATLTFHYDAAYDILALFGGVPQGETLDALDDTWYLRLAGDRVTGVELHGLTATLLRYTFLTDAFEAARAEVEAVSSTVLRDGLHVQEAAADMPHTTRLLLVLLGMALEKLHTVELDELQALKMAELAQT